MTILPMIAFSLLHCFCVNHITSWEERGKTTPRLQYYLTLLSVFLCFRVSRKRQDSTQQKHIAPAFTVQKNSFVYKIRNWFKHGVNSVYGSAATCYYEEYCRPVFNYLANGGRPGKPDKLLHATVSEVLRRPTRSAGNLQRPRGVRDKLPFLSTSKPSSFKSHPKHSLPHF